MKRLILMRHSIAAVEASTDFERKLTERGIVKSKSQAMKLDDYLEKNGIEIDFSFVSSAVRTKETFEYVTCLLEIKETPHVFTRALYLTGIRELKRVFIDYNDKIEDFDTIMLFLHNNGVSKIASRLSDMSIYFDTANIAILTFDDRVGEDINEKKILWNKSLDYEGNWELDYFI